MPPFGKPRMSRTRDVLWMRTAKSKNFAQPEFLWRHLWPKLFFADALAAAKEAENHTQLEELMKKKLDERSKEMESLLLKVAYAVAGNRDMLLSPSSRKLASRICQTGSLDNFMQFLGRSTFGWGDETLERKEQPRISNGYISDNWDDADLDPDHPDFQTQPDSETELIVPISPPGRPVPPQNSHRRIGTNTAASTDHGASPAVNRPAAADNTATTQAPSAVSDPWPKNRAEQQRRRGARPSSGGTAKEEQGVTQVGNSPGSLRRAKRVRFADGEERSETGDDYRRCKRRVTDEQANSQSTRASSRSSMLAQKRLPSNDSDDEIISHEDAQNAKRHQLGEEDIPIIKTKNGQPD